MWGGGALGRPAVSAVLHRVPPPMALVVMRRVVMCRVLTDVATPMVRPRSALHGDRARATRGPYQRADRERDREHDRESSRPPSSHGS